MKTGWLTMTLALALLTGCGAESWQTKEIDGLMPSLGFELTGESGEPLTEAAFDDDVTILYFGYTFCPDVCPATLARLAATLEAMPDDAAGDVKVLFVSVDPDRDTPERLRRYTDAFGEAFVGATGTQAQLRDFTRRYRVTYGYGDKNANGNYLVTHASAQFVFDRRGEARLLFRSDDAVDAMAGDLTQLVRD